MTVITVEEYRCHGLGCDVVYRVHTPEGLVPSRLDFLKHPPDYKPGHLLVRVSTETVHAQDYRKMIRRLIF